MPLEPNVAAASGPELQIARHDTLDDHLPAHKRQGGSTRVRLHGEQSVAEDQGVSDEATANSLRVTRHTIQRDWCKARMLLRQALST
jgi:hypothetical protein